MKLVQFAAELAVTDPEGGTELGIHMGLVAIVVAMCRTCSDETDIEAADSGGVREREAGASAQRPPTLTQDRLLGDWFGLRLFLREETRPASSDSFEKASLRLDGSCPCVEPLNLWLSPKVAAAVTSE
jgi:hypothetical protein